jgi:hypothetical protein
MGRVRSTISVAWAIDAAATATIPAASASPLSSAPSQIHASAVARPAADAAQVTGASTRAEGRVRALTPARLVVL